MNSNEDVNTTVTDEANASTDATARAIDDVIDAAIDLGTVWVRYGLQVGHLALKTQSAWLKGMSDLMGHVADVIDPAANAKSERERAAEATTRAQ